MKKVSGYKKAVGEYNSWTGHAEIMYDRTEKTVWCDVFTSGQEWREYHDENVVRILRKGHWQMESNWNTTSMKKVLDRIERFEQYGYIEE